MGIRSGPGQRQIRTRQRVRQHQQEGFPRGMPLEKCHRFLHQRVRQAEPPISRSVLRQRNLFTVAPNRCRVAGLERRRRQQPRPFVKPVRTGRRGFLVAAQVPAAHKTRRIFGHAHHLCYRSLIGAQLERQLAVLNGVRGVAACHQGPHRRLGGIPARISMSEPTPLLGQTIDVRRRNQFLAVTTNIAITKLMCHDQDDIWHLVALPGGGGISHQIRRLFRTSPQIADYCYERYETETKLQNSSWHRNSPRDAPPQQRKASI